MAVTTEAQPETPSHNFEEQIHKILTPTNVRKQFNDTIACYKNLSWQINERYYPKNEIKN